MRFYYVIISEKKWLVYNISAGGQDFLRALTYLIYRIGNFASVVFCRLNHSRKKKFNSILVLIRAEAVILMLLKTAAL